MKRALVIFLLLAFAAVFPTVAKKKEEKSDTSHEESYYNFMESSGNLSLMVYSYPAHWRAKAKAIPLWITVVLAETEEGGGPVEFGLENLTLIDAEGNSYPPVEFSELQKIYKEQMSDQNVMRERPVAYGNTLDNYMKISADFYPAARNMRLSGNTVELDTFTAYHGFIYFPQPKAGLKGVMKMRLEGGDIKTPIEVKFKVP